MLQHMLNPRRAHIVQQQDQVHAKVQQQHQRRVISKFAQPPQALANLGISKTPANYQADSLWSYEAGTKLALFGNRVSVDTAAARASKYFITCRQAPMPGACSRAMSR